MLVGLTAEVGADDGLHAGAVVEVDEERPHAARQLGPDAALLATEHETLRARRHRVVGAGEDDLIEAPVAELDVAVAAGLGHGRVGDVRRLKGPHEREAAEEHHDARDGDHPGHADRQPPSRSSPDVLVAALDPVHRAEQVEQPDRTGDEREERDDTDHDRGRRLRPPHGEEAGGDRGQAGHGPPRRRREQRADPVAEHRQPGADLPRAGLRRRQGEHGADRDGDLGLHVDEVRGAPEHGTQCGALPHVVAQAGRQVDADSEQRKVDHAGDDEAEPDHFERSAPVPRFAYRHREAGQRKDRERDRQPAGE